MPMFETQVLDRDYDRPSQHLEQSESVKIIHERNCSTHISPFCSVIKIYVLYYLDCALDGAMSSGNLQLLFFPL